MCDIHHIKPIREGGTDDHENLSYLCPNCHRLAHNDKLEEDKIKNLKEYFKDDWMKKYYG